MTTIKSDNHKLKETKDVKSTLDYRVLILLMVFGCVLLYDGYNYFTKSLAHKQQEVDKNHPSNNVFQPSKETIVSEYPGIFNFEPININNADKVLLMTIPGIGPSYADRILQYRIENGFFRNTEDLKLVPGIGEKKAASFSRFLSFNIEDEE